MHAEFSVELGPDADALELPWASPDGAQRYFDLRSRPELLLEIPETRRNRALGEFLAAINAPASPLLTVKCDTWTTDQITEEEKMYGAALKYASYIDLMFVDPQARLSTGEYEHFAKALCALLGKAPEISAGAEFILRRCYIHPAPEKAGTSPGNGESLDGYCLTFYLSGFGDEDAEARQRWTIALKLVENAILQLAARRVGQEW